jgi:hypothetical protein
MKRPRTVSRMLHLSGAREGACPLRNRVDSELRNEIRDPAIVAPRRPEGTHGLPAAAPPGPPQRLRGCGPPLAAAIENP